ncbi:hypothetical protein [Opitutus terrae]|uniref:Uncharacterized protein n=1 Tax=Opitutus terrae (strain DSM 11246 / JCM 15787 / PB90-1) TaxID=452637 RepID=B1ZWL3_OPITP|nr:hypothetical protein [Opitutus terrae]ACB73337.1 hypothetical protein Oter_0046 [Opitutus terrae PB90-1]
MNLSNDPTTGRILLHGKGTGGISRADIERRARELADIDGRSGADITDDDLARAKADLLGLQRRRPRSRRTNPIAIFPAIPANQSPTVASRPARSKDPTRRRPWSGSPSRVSTKPNTIR